MSSISIIGTGNMARTIGARAVAGGNTVEVIGRDQSKAADLAKALGGGATTGEWGTAPAGDIVIMALLYDGVVPVVAQYGDALADKVIVDISNPFNSTFDGLAHSEETEKGRPAALCAGGHPRRERPHLAVPVRFPASGCARRREGCLGGARRRRRAR
jgi:8-hydroxy-5-deazaflavin:NADPH oxidoreductase